MTIKANVEIIDYKGKKIVYVLGTENESKEQALANVEKYNELVSSFPEKGALSLLDLSHGNKENDVLKKWQEHSEFQTKYVKKSAVIGVKGLMAVVFMAYKVYVRLRGIPIDNIIKTFDNIEIAKEWLISEN